MNTNTLSKAQGLALVKSIILANYGHGDFGSLSVLPWDKLLEALKSCGDPLLRYLLVECSEAEGCQNLNDAAARLNKLSDEIKALAGMVEEAAGIVSTAGSATHGDVGIELVRSVRIKRQSTMTKSYDAIVVVIADMHLSMDLTSDRDIRLASALARSHGVDMDVTPELQDRVKAALS